MNADVRLLDTPFDPAEMLRQFTAAAAGAGKRAQAASSG